MSHEGECTHNTCANPFSVIIVSSLHLSSPPLCHAGIATPCRWLLKEFRSIDRGNSRRCVKRVKRPLVHCVSSCLWLEVNEVDVRSVMLHQLYSVCVCVRAPCGGTSPLHCTLLHSTGAEYTSHPTPLCTVHTSFDKCTIDTEVCACVYASRIHNYLSVC